MERLTRECWQYTHNDCEDEEAQSFANKLATYEDTGLEPSEIESLKSELQAYKQKLADGRMVELPCKEETQLFLSDYPTYQHKLKEYVFIGGKVAIRIECFQLNAICTRWLDDIGKTVFLTESEALFKLGVGE